MSPACWEALNAYNEAAAKYRFTPCNRPTEDQAKRLAKRLKAIGGIKQFKRALSVIHQDEFLMGRLPGKAGGKPYRLSLDGLMRTTDANGNPRDVLAKLIEMADERDQAAGPVGAAEPDAALDALIASPFGQRTLASEGHENGMKILRARIANGKMENS